MISGFQVHCHALERDLENDQAGRAGEDFHSSYRRAYKPTWLIEGPQLLTGVP